MEETLFLTDEGFQEHGCCDFLLGRSEPQTIIIPDEVEQEKLIWWISFLRKFGLKYEIKKISMPYFSFESILANKKIGVPPDNSHVAIISRAYTIKKGYIEIGQDEFRIGEEANITSLDFIRAWCYIKDLPSLPIKERIVSYKPEGNSLTYLTALRYLWGDYHKGLIDLVKKISKELPAYKALALAHFKFPYYEYGLLYYSKPTKIYTATQVKENLKLNDSVMKTFADNDYNKIIKIKSIKIRNIIDSLNSMNYKKAWQQVLEMQNV